MRQFPQFLLAWLVIPLAGCSTYDLAPTSGHGYVVRLYTATDVQKVRPPCLENVSEQVLAQHRYAEIKVWYGRRARYLVASIPEQVRTTVGDEVEISPRSCSEVVLPEIKQVLRPAGQ
jgi:hypothetical protein